jgi:condensin complex subunit 1
VCLHDAEPRVAALAEWFFTELSKRGNQVFNLLPDMLSHMSKIAADNALPSLLHRVDAGPPPPVFGQAAFRSATKFLLSLLDKDKHLDGLAEKLLQRLSGGAAGSTHNAASADTERALWRDVAYCL